MSHGTPPDTGAPGWEYLIAHHQPDRYCRTLTLRTPSGTLHFCARCTGELVGFVGLALAFVASPVFARDLTTPIGGVVLAALPSLAWIDWLSQSVGSRESTNLTRLGSGGLLGVALGGLVVFGVTRDWLLFGTGLAVLATYLAAAALGLQWKGVLERVVLEHFP
jgi:uncharacterized membrane protein